MVFIVQWPVDDGAAIGFLARRTEAIVMDAKPIKVKAECLNINTGSSRD